MVALDTLSDQYVCAPTDPEDPRLEDLWTHGYTGDRTLVCALCYAGVGAPPGTVVPVVVKGRVGGMRRPHFAHPAVRGPVGGAHDPESVWHLVSKTVLAEWSRTQPGVIDVRTEVWLPNHERRCDVQVVFADGNRVVLEAQRSPVTDADWSRRHRDYVDSGVVDAWLWHPDSPLPWVVLADTDHPQQMWLFDPWEPAITLLVGAPHTRPHPSAGSAVVDRVEHLPPCIGDDLRPYRFALHDVALTPAGVQVPVSLQTRLAAAAEQERRRSLTATPEIARIRQWSNTFEIATSTTKMRTRNVEEKLSSARESVNSAAQAQLDWLALQNAVMAAGHDIDYRDAPNLPLPPTKPRTVRCTRCAALIPPTLGPDAVARCPQRHRATEAAAPVEPGIGVGGVGYLPAPAPAWPSPDAAWSRTRPRRGCRRRGSGRGR
ncbi:competence protein CoiA family protein [Nocardia abscessus]|uniref:competence protein CoiA family protein n=2 Tax=Nocardia abscessus TaxID=120957 RepID=UPI00278C6D0F|nr:competence protein CoiA family protein [Nocardia abscessus]